MLSGWQQTRVRVGMPRNRRSTPRAERVDELLDVAEQLLLERGYGDTSVSEVARRSGVAPNAVHWYFADKDALLGAVLTRLFDREQGALGVAPGADDPVGRLLQALAVLERYRSFGALVHERAPHSDAVDAFHRRFHAWLGDLLDEALEDRLPDAEPERTLAKDVVSAVLENALAHAGTGTDRPFERVVRYVIDRVAAPPP